MMKGALDSAVVSAVISGLIVYFNSKMDENLKYITAKRSNWREKISEITLRLYGASYNKTLKIITELKVHINAFGM